MYNKVIAYLKENALDLVKECTYQPWDEATENRVHLWINTVLNMQDPKIGSVENAESTAYSPEPSAGTTNIPTEDFLGTAEDDLPF